ncbi:MAG: fibronectin type III domain-containing protein [Clostridiales bacterium]|nr:fibronectin type III domain-containing protein [Clostridiales bacterium]
MKRFLSVLLVALLLAAAVPPTAPPADMVTASVAYTAPSPAYVGDTITFSVSNESGVGPYSYAYWIYLNGARTFWHAYYIPNLRNFGYPTWRPGNYYGEAWVYDEGDLSHIRLQTYNTITVSLRPSPRISQVSAYSVYGTQLLLDWNDIAGADGYEVWRGLSRLGAYTLVGTPTASRFVNSGLTPGTQYFYKVRAYNMIESYRVVSGKFSGAYAGIPLAKPAIKSLIATGTERVHMSWTAVPGATGYQVYVGTAPTNMRAVRTTAATGMTVTGLTTGKSFYLAVRGYRRIAPNTYYGPLSGYLHVYTLR